MPLDTGFPARGHAVVGQPIDRRDGRLKVTGRARYAAEFDIDNLAYAVLVESTIASGEITGFDVSRAQAAPGVLAVVTPENAPHLPQAAPGQSETTGPLVAKPLLQDNLVYYNGQHIAVVVADTLERAQQAAALVRAQYREAEAEIRMQDGLRNAYAPLHFRNGARPPDSRRGDPETAFASAPAKIDAAYTTPVEHHNPMELLATIALWEGDGDNKRLTVYNATQGISNTRNALAKLFGLKPEQVRAICPFVGGGFGCKGNTWPHTALAAMAAGVVNRPVKLVVERKQMFTANGYRPRTIQRLRLGADSEGRLLALIHEGLTSMSHPALGEFSEPVGLVSEMLYATPNNAVTHRLVPLNMPLPTYMRAPGEASGSFALESAMDELAAALKVDPLELRLRNYAETDPHENKPFSSKSLRQCYADGAAAFGWARRPVEPGSMRDGPVLIGWGMATATYPTNRSAAGARIVFESDGTVAVQSGTQDLGTGTYTTMAQLAADALAMPLHRVRFELGDSAFPNAPVSGGSQTSASVSSAVLAAAEAARRRLFELALAANRSPLAGTSSDDLELADGFVRLRSAPHRQIGIPALLARSGVERLAVEQDAKPGDEKKRYSMHAFGAQFAEVRVDRELAQIRVSRFVGAYSGGRILNLKTARSQALGGITMGIGMALMEATHIDPNTGRVVYPNVSEYVMPVNADIPDITTIFIEEEDRHVNPAGVKGLGELPIVGAAAAVANAVWHATGIRVRDLPITPEKILA
ncbi:MAG: xanthine dehydrogenase family protein molybdopterin-binding subunit [Alphaproteobacteria bacterium]|nr:xanthine dehydrogenase family protein molybdopterin-binding subunit [Alphaproteobacteria bacterium]MBV9964060.1 xanthine dehydrogenase family protein molybdopterin-binding subunit [Alphaproteobacteria bacterium]